MHPMRLVSRSLLIVLGILILTVFLERKGLLAPVETGTAMVLQPAQRFLLKIFPFKSSSPGVTQQVRDLEDRVTRLTVENLRLQEALQQKTATENGTRALALRQLHGIGAAVIGRGSEGDEQTVIIDRGTGDGLAEGQPVVADDGVLIGIVASVRSKQSIVSLIINPRIAVGAEVVNETHSQGIVSGEHGLTLRMQLIPQGERVEVGQQVVTSNIDAQVPSNLLIGDIIAVHYNTGDLFQEASISPVLDVQKQRYVMVVQQ